MYQKFVKTLRNMHRNQSGITGLETAIILIAFVTVAAVLAYSVLSAGIFSSERAKETVYEGLEQAEGSVELTSNVLGLSANQTELEQVQFFIALTMRDDEVDTDAFVINYWDRDTHAEGVASTFELATDSAERGASHILEADEQFKVTVTIPAAANVVAYESFTVQVLPPTGNCVTILRHMPGALLKVIDLQ